MTLTKVEFAESIFDEIGLNKREAKDMVELFFEEGNFFSLGYLRLSLLLPLLQLF